MKPVKCFIFIVVVFCTSCYKDVSLTSPLTAKITSTSLPDSAQPAIKTNFILYFEKPDPCTEIAESVIERFGDTMEYKIKLHRPGSPCVSNPQKDSLVEAFQKDEPGILYFRFFTSENEYWKDSVIIRIHKDPLID